MIDVLYLHGFLSSPKSGKAQQTLEWCRQHRPDIQLHIPQLSNYPGKVAIQLDSLLADTPALLENGLKVIGSSMGGFLASWLVEKYGGKAVLINPAVKPYELLLDYLGEHSNPYSGEKFNLVASDMQILKALSSDTLSIPSHYRVLLQTHDETLDYREAASKYQHSQLVIEEGGNHSFINYDKHLKSIFAFLQG